MECHTFAVLVIFGMLPGIDNKLAEFLEARLEVSQVGKGVAGLKRCKCKTWNSVRILWV